MRTRTYFSILSVLVAGYVLIYQFWPIGGAPWKQRELTLLIFGLGTSVYAVTYRPRQAIRIVPPWVYVVGCLVTLAGAIGIDFSPLAKSVASPITAACFLGWMFFVNPRPRRRQTSRE